MRVRLGLPLTSGAKLPLFPLPAGRTAAAARAGFAAIERGGGKSGLQGSTVAANGRRGRPQGKCHREETAGAGQLVQARVKRCGKSAPRLRRRRRHGKPHREQDRIGAARVLGATLASSAILAAARVGCSRHGAIRAPEEWPSRRDPLQTEPGLQAGWQLQTWACVPGSRRAAEAIRDPVPFSSKRARREVVDRIGRQDPGSPRARSGRGRIISGLGGAPATPAAFFVVLCPSQMIASGGI
jgi:hypothetical protein